MSLALPPVAHSPTPPPSWPLKGLALVVAAVLGLHAWLLGGMPLPAPWATDSAPQDADTVALHTRVLPPAKAAPPLAPPARPQPTAPAPVRPAAARPAPPTGITTANSQPFTAPAHTNTAPAAPEFIANPAHTRVAEPSPPAGPVEPERPQRYAFPPPVRLNYDVWALTSGNRNTGGAQLSWQHDGNSYQASLLATKFRFHLRQWTSKGTLAEAGLAPLRFGDKGRSSEVAAHFVREEGKVVFSANTPEAPLLPGAQDHLSVFMQLASLWAGEPQRHAAGDSISFQSIGPRQSETWTFVVSPEEPITVPGGTFPAIKLTREPTGDYSTKAELWLAPTLAYLPAHIRLSESNGNVLDMVWTDSQPP